MSGRVISSPVPGRCEVKLVHGTDAGHPVDHLEIRAAKYIRVLSMLVCIGTFIPGFIYFLAWNLHIFPYLGIAAAISSMLWLGHVAIEIDEEVVVISERIPGRPDPH